MIVKFSKNNFGPNFDPLPDGIFEKLQREDKRQKKNLEGTKEPPTTQFFSKNETYTNKHVTG